ncbi:MAG: hypothetical protein AAB250_08070 [Bdellovibrionota bacterium]
MENTRAKILKSIQQRPIKPADLVQKVSKGRNEAEVEAALRTLIVQGVVVLNANRKLELPVESSL